MRATFSACLFSLSFVSSSTLRSWLRIKSIRALMVLRLYLRVCGISTGPVSLKILASALPLGLPSPSKSNSFFTSSFSFCCSITLVRSATNCWWALCNSLYSFTSSSICSSSFLVYMLMLCPAILYNGQVNAVERGSHHPTVVIMSNNH
jgi:hypothetical protein